MLNKSIVWVKDWVGRRDILGASRTPFRELAGENPLECKIHMRMSWKVVPARVKLEITLRFLASGDNYQSLT